MSILVSMGSPALIFIQTVRGHPDTRGCQRIITNKQEEIRWEGRQRIEEVTREAHLEGQREGGKRRHEGE